MQGTENPYAAPLANSMDVRNVEQTKKRKLFSPKQGAVGAFLLGPITGLYIIYANFSVIEDYPKRLNTIAYGSAIVIIISLLLPFIPEKFPAIFFSLMYMLPTSFLMDKYQLKKQQIIDSDAYTFQSNWMVLGIGLLGSILFLVLVLMSYILCSTLGLVPSLW